MELVGADLDTTQVGEVGRVEPVGEGGFPATVLDDCGGAERLRDRLASLGEPPHGVRQIGHQRIGDREPTSRRGDELHRFVGRVSVP